MLTSKVLDPNFNSVNLTVGGYGGGRGTGPGGLVPGGVGQGGLGGGIGMKTNTRTHPIPSNTITVIYNASNIVSTLNWPIITVDVIVFVFIVVLYFYFLFQDKEGRALNQVGFHMLNYS